MTGNPVRIVYSVLAGVLLFIVTLAIVFVLFPHSVTIIAPITPDDSSLLSPPVIVSHTFPFEDTHVTISVPVNYSVYSGAKKTDRNPLVIGNVSNVNAEVYRSMINDPSQEILFNDLLVQFRAVKAERDLTDDEYLELMTVFAQSLPYSVVPDTPAKFPVETVMDKTGDCDDKSLLLAGLLSREGYPVVLFLFGPEKHMAVGVGSDSFLYKSTGYSYVEATTCSFVGVPAYYLKENGTLKSDPLIIPINNGTKRYRSGDATSHIDNMSALSGQRAAELSRTLRQKPINEWENRTEYVSGFHQLNYYSEIHNYILAHKFDRPGVYAYLQREMPA
ncbi:MAG: hypothetical protein WC379_12335 [Methanoregula sp.]|jgi:hypothetical protein